MKHNEDEHDVVVMKIILVYISTGKNGSLVYICVYIPTGIILVYILVYIYMCISILVYICLSILVYIHGDLCTYWYRLVLIHTFLHILVCIHTGVQTGIDWFWFWCVVACGGSRGRGL